MFFLEPTPREKSRLAEVSETLYLLSLETSMEGFSQRKDVLSLF